MAHPPAESFEGVHSFFISCLVFAHIIHAAARRRWEWVELRHRPRARILSVALHVSDFLVELQIVGLQRLDLCSELRDDLELFP